MFKVGLGYDIHKLEKGNGIILGGVSIPYSKSFIAHSDGDVLIHAIIDALLGVCSDKDIGEIFPNSDKKYLNISSLKLLQQVFDMYVLDKFKILNLDCIIIAQEPKLSKYKIKMKKNISSILNISQENISIKAKTNEGIGIIGKSEAIASFCTILVKKITN